MKNVCFTGCIYLLFFFLFQNSAFSQNIGFATQSEINTVGPTLSGTITSLSIFDSGTDPITDLSPLINITEIAENLSIISNPQLETLDGLDGLTNIQGSCAINLNETLTDISALSNLTSISGFLWFASNDDLETINGLNNLESIGERLAIQQNNSLIDITALSNLNTVGGEVLIFKNPVLENVNGLNNLESIGEYLSIAGNLLLTDISAFSNLKTVGNSLVIQDNAILESLNGLNNLVSIGASSSFIIRDNPLLKDISALSNIPSCTWMWIVGNTSLESLNGLEGLTTVTTDVQILQNNSLNDISALSNLTSIGTYLYIRNNGALESLNGLENLNSIGNRSFINNNNSLIDISALAGLSVGEAFIITNNPLLCNCQAILDINCPVFGINNNDVGCNNLQEIEQGLGCVSSSCMEVDISNIQCINQGTADPSDDEWIFEMSVQTTSPLTCNYWDAEGDYNASGSYNKIKVVHMGDISNYGSTIEFTVTDGCDSDCQETVVVEVPEPCSVPCKFSVENYEVSACVADEYYVSFTVEGSEGQCWMAKQKTSGGVDIILGTFYGDQHVVLGPFDPADDNWTLWVKICDQVDCVMDFVVVAPTDCIGTQRSQNTTFEENANEFKVYPNPMSDFVNVEIGNEFMEKKGSGFVQISNIVGKVQITKAINVEQVLYVSTKDLTPGVYIISVLDDSNELIWTSKLIK